MRNIKIGLTSLLVCCGISAYAVMMASGVAANASGAIAKTTASAAVAKTSAASGFSIDPNSPVTEQLLDHCWENRENLTNQKIIADYLMTKPAVPADYATSWKAARLVYFIGNYGVGEQRFVKSSEGATLFDYGAKAGLAAQAANPSGVEGYYWYAIDLGSYGLAKGVLASASGSKQGMAALEKAKSIDAGFQWYGSSRILGRYYQELPGIFGGSSDKALTLIKGAADAAPNFSNNLVFLGQYYINVSQYDKALAACKNALSLAPVDGKYEEMRYRKEANQCVAKAQSKLN